MLNPTLLPTALGVDENAEFSLSKDAPGAGARPFYFEDEPGWRMAIN